MSVQIILRHRQDLYHLFVYEYLSKPLVSEKNSKEWLQFHFMSAPSDMPKDHYAWPWLSVVPPHVSVNYYWQLSYNWTLKM